MYAHLMSVYPESIRQDEKMTSGRHIFFTLFSIQPVRERATQPRSTVQCCSMHCCLDTTSPNQAWDGTQQKTPDVGDEAYAAPGHLKPSVLFTSKNRTWDCLMKPWNSSPLYHHCYYPCMFCRPCFVARVITFPAGNLYWNWATFLLLFPSNTVNQQSGL